MKGKFEQYSKRTGFFYVGSVLKRFIRGGNILAFLYMAINYGITFFFFYAMAWSVQDGLIGASFFMFISLFVALTPIGEFILREVHGFKDLYDSKKEDKKILDRINPLLLDVVERAKAVNPDFYLDKHLHLYVKDDFRPNAYTIGRRTLCITTGLLRYSNDEIKGILAHEVHHLTVRDSELVLFISTANLFLVTITTIFKVMILIGQTIFSFILSLFSGNQGFLVSIVSAIGNLLQVVCVNIVLWLWTALGVAMIKHSAKKSEYAADAFACDLNLGRHLHSFLSGYPYENTFDPDFSISKDLKEKTSFFALLSRKHPATEKRLARIEERLAEFAEIEDGDLFEYDGQ